MLWMISLEIARTAISSKFRNATGFPVAFFDNYSTILRPFDGYSECKDNAVYAHIIFIRIFRKIPSLVSIFPKKMRIKLSQSTEPGYRPLPVRLQPNPQVVLQGAAGLAGTGIPVLPGRFQTAASAGD